MEDATEVPPGLPDDRGDGAGRCTGVHVGAGTIHQFAAATDMQAPA
jgi:hypothetical protein